MSRSGTSQQSKNKAVLGGMASEASHNPQREGIPPFIWREPLYTEAQRIRRDNSIWTIVQGILAPLQLVVFAISLFFVVRFLMTGEGWLVATISICVKTAILYTIMITGSIWEKEVFGKYLFARPFFWEDVFSMLVLALHTVYLALLAAEILVPGTASHTLQMTVALAAYATYIINAAQFLFKLRLARLDGSSGAFASSPAEAAR